MTRTVDRHGLLPNGSRVLVAVSGGVDSMVMLYLLHALVSGRRWRLTVAHLNHCLRGRSSDADARFVQIECRKLGVPCVLEREDVRGLAKRRGLSIEMAAREVRHRFLARAAKRRKCSVIALAHHADDQAELVLMRLLRGSGSEGLGGMGFSNASPMDAKIRLVRPLLEVQRATILAFAKGHRIRYREDKSNSSTVHFRNKVRHELLPLLQKDYQPAIERVLCRVASILSAEADCINGLATQWWLNRKQPFERLPLAVRRKVIHQQALTSGLNLDFETVEQLLVGPGRRVTAPGGQLLVCQLGGKLSLVCEPRFRGSKATIELDLTSSGEARFGNLNLSWDIKRAGQWKRPKQQPGRECFDAAQVGRRIILRHWRAGDRFQPIGMAKSVKLQDLFTNSKVSRGDRVRRVVAESEGGEVFWVEGLRIGERFKLGRDSRKVLVWRWKCY